MEPEWLLIIVPSYWLIWLSYKRCELGCKTIWVARPAKLPDVGYWPFLFDEPNSGELTRFYVVVPFVALLLNMNRPTEFIFGLYKSESSGLAESFFIKSSLVWCRFELLFEFRLLARRAGDCRPIPIPIPSDYN